VSRSSCLRGGRLHLGPCHALAALALVVVAGCFSTRPTPPTGASALAASQARVVRVAAARQRDGGAVDRMERHAGVRPPAPLVLLAFKQERRLELWGWARARSRYVLVATYPILAASGVLGPKRSEGDHQVPEGFYHVTNMNPASLYHLSLELDYPNRSDRILGDPRAPGSKIFIHGDAVSDGCIPIGDHAIEQVYLAVLDSRVAGYDVSVGIFPCRFSSAACRGLLSERSAGRPALAAFWANLAEGYEAFTQTGLPPRVSVEASGRYAFEPGREATLASRRD
jgi:murein L,D-transpeptidase YafK